MLYYFISLSLLLSKIHHAEIEVPVATAFMAFDQRGCFSKSYRRRSGGALSSACSSRPARQAPSTSRSASSSWRRGCGSAEMQKCLSAFELQAPFVSLSFVVIGYELLSSDVGGIGYF